MCIELNDDDDDDVLWVSEMTMLFFTHHNFSFEDFLFFFTFKYTFTELGDLRSRNE